MNIRIYCTGDKLFQPEKYAWVHGVNSTVQDSYHVLIKLIVRGDEKFLSQLPHTFFGVKASDAS
jgi:hypothetical protein